MEFRERLKQVEHLVAEYADINTCVNIEYAKELQLQFDNHEVEAKDIELFKNPKNNEVALALLEA